MSEYIGNRVVPKHDGVWDSTKVYEPLVIVYEEGTGDSYISRKDVPAGTGQNQKEYWALCARFSEQVALLRKETAGQVAHMEERTSAAETLTRMPTSPLPQIKTRSTRRNWRTPVWMIQITRLLPQAQMSGRWGRRGLCRISQSYGNGRMADLSMTRGTFHKRKLERTLYGACRR